MGQQEFKPKIRVQLLNEVGCPLSDRLVDQTIELTNGPKGKWDGPIRLDVTLTCQQDIDGLKQYIDVLRGELPVKEVGTRGRPSTPGVELKSPREDILVQVENLVKDNENQDNVIKYLRGLGFVFLLTEEFLIYFPDFKFNIRDVGEPNLTGQYPKSLSWMVRRIKQGKDPKTDKYDPQIIFGFKILGGREKKFVPYLYKDRKDPLRSAIPEKNAIGFSNTEMTKFPPYMIEEERLKFSTEMRTLLLNSEKKPSKFFIRWHPDVIYSKAIKDKVEEAIAR